MVEESFGLERTPGTCPSYGSEKIAMYTYGYRPVKWWARLEMRKDGNNAKHIHRGCVIHENSPRWHCMDCRHDWGKAL